MKEFNLENNWRDNVVSCAVGYANHIWKAVIQNSCHGYDRDGILVNTPDTNYISSNYNCGWWQIDQVNKGIPYNWGGYTTLEEFDTGIAAGKYAGNVPDSRDNGVGRDCVGIDCSGLVTICWGLRERVNTKSIPSIASVLGSMDLLLPGDVILLPGSHVMIFINFTDKLKMKAHIVDASRKNGRVLLRTVSLPDLSQEGYSGFRYSFESIQAQTQNA